MDSTTSIPYKKSRPDIKMVSVSVNAMDEGGRTQLTNYRDKEKIRLSLQSFSTKHAQTLVVYVYSNTDPEYQYNLVYFLKTGVKADDGCDYVIIIQEGEGVEETHDLPSTPPNVRFVRHANECFDWGTFGWALEHKIVDTSKYKYFIMLNSSVRGPFLPPYWPSHLHWSDGLTSRLSDEVRLVGSTISCEGSWKGGVLTGEKRQNPHVQSYVVAMDDVALNLMRQDSTVLKCYNQYHDAVWYGEMGSSAVILRAGYNIDALMVRYQGIDWRQTENWGCNGALNPYAEHMYDGIDVSPFEVMFVKFKEFLLEANWTVAMQSKKYSEWRMHEDKNIRENEYNSKKEQLRLTKIVGMRQRGSACFDFELYRKRNPDLPKWGEKDLWEHFVKHGQHEGRVFRFLCKSSPPVGGGGVTVAGATGASTTSGSLAAQGQATSAATKPTADALPAPGTLSTGPPNPLDRLADGTAAQQVQQEQQRPVPGAVQAIQQASSLGTGPQDGQLQGQRNGETAQQVQQSQSARAGAQQLSAGGAATALQQPTGAMQQLLLPAQNVAVAAAQQGQDQNVGAAQQLAQGQGKAGNSQQLQGRGNAMEEMQAQNAAVGAQGQTVMMAADGATMMQQAERQDGVQLQ